MGWIKQTFTDFVTVITASFLNGLQDQIIADEETLDEKVDKVSGKSLSTNDFTTVEKNKLAGIEAGAEKNPDLTHYVTDSDYNPAAKTSAMTQSVGKDSNGKLWTAPGGTTNYSDLSNKPSINSVELSGNKTAAQLGLAAASDIPSSTSDLTNDSGFIDAVGAAAAAPVQSVNGQTGAVVLDADDVGAIEAPASATAGQFLVYNGTTWAATTVPSASGVSF